MNASTKARKALKPISMAEYVAAGSVPFAKAQTAGGMLWVYQYAAGTARMALRSTQMELHLTTLAFRAESFCQAAVMSA